MAGSHRRHEAPRNRILLYSQHMAGTGHFVRTSEIANSLSRRNEIYLVDGGRPVPRELSQTGITVVSLPRIRRDEQCMIVPFESDEPVDVVLQQRRGILLAAIEVFRPQIVMIEHFPFRRWELFSEITSMIQAARAIDRNVKIVCSLRDIPGSSRVDLPTEEHGRDVLNILHEYFDQLLVHADPRVVSLHEQTALAKRIEIPLEYTGYVSQGVRREKHGAATEPQKGTVMVSAGGTGDTALLTCTIDAWRQLESRRAVGDRRLLAFLPLTARGEDVTRMQGRVDSKSVRLLPYAADFLDHMQTGDLSISHAGYNTCTNLLETRTRAILVPNLKMSDQALRATRFAELRLAVSIDPSELTPDRLAGAILEQLHAPPFEHDIHLGGADATCRVLEQLCAVRRAKRPTAGHVPSHQAA